MNNGCSLTLLLLVYYTGLLLIPFACWYTDVRKIGFDGYRLRLFAKSKYPNSVMTSDLQVDISIAAVLHRIFAESSVQELKKWFRTTIDKQF